MDCELLFIALTTINGYVSQNTDTACWYTKNHFLKFTQIQVGATYPSWFTLPLTQDFGAGTVYT